jgi:hypothetical protein
MKEIKDYTEYQKITGEQIFEETGGLFKSYIRDAMSVWGSDFQYIIYDENTFLEIVERVFKRKIYFKVFHSVAETSLLKEISLYCFWILKLQPFAYKQVKTIEDKGKTNYELNAKMALSLFTKGLAAYANENGKRVNIASPDILRDLFYSFRYDDLSKEAMICLAKSLIIDEQSIINFPQKAANA